MIIDDKNQRTRAKSPGVKFPSVFGKTARTVMLADAFAHDSLSFNQTAQYDLAILSNIILIDDEDILLENVATGLAMPLPVMSKAELWMGSAMTKLTRIFNATIGFFLAAKAQTEP